MSTHLSTSHECTKRPYQVDIYGKYYFWHCDACPYRAHGMAAFKDQKEKEAILELTSKY